jgi:3-methyladenine DNA glycosylase AlkD
LRYRGPVDAEAVVTRLTALGNERDRAGMARFGINVDRALGVSVTTLRRLCRELPADHDLAAALWETGIHEARILASMVDEPAMVTATQMDAWARDFDSWDLCDQCCQNLFWRAEHADSRARRWARRRAEFVKRAAFALMASSALKDRAAPDERFLAYLDIVEGASTDPRNFVRKAVSWALRQIGKRDRRLHRAAVATARRIGRLDAGSARWVASDALRELTDPTTLARIPRMSGGRGR